nr:unnamed protein product [Callosobruchus analis]
MDTIGAEVGQKMRSAIKAKLLELSCYVDDELPDYIMVMVANKRTKSQMNEDLHLFLSDKTDTFVEWLHIVLKKLKEVTVTNPEVYKRVAKRKSDHLDTIVKKEKKNKKAPNIALKSEDKPEKNKEDVNKIADNRKITIIHGSENMQDNFDIPLLSEVNASNTESLKDIEQRIRNVKSRLGLLVDSDIEIELDEKDPIEDISLRKLKELRNSEVKEESKRETLENSNAEAQSSSIESNPSTRNNMENTDFSPNIDEKKSKHKPITFDGDSPPPKKLSVLERLGKKPTEISKSDFKRMRITLEPKQIEDGYRQHSREKSREKRDTTREKRDRSGEARDRRRSFDRRGDRRRQEQKAGSREKRRDRESMKKDHGTEIENNSNRNILSRLGVMSKVSVPQKDPEPEHENELKTREVRSVVQVKPRVISNVTQPNKNLLLKAVAEAHRSVALSMKSGSSKSKSLLTKTPKLKNEEIVMYNTRKLPHSEKTKLRNLILSQFARENAHNSDEEDVNEEKAEVYIPKPIRHSRGDVPKYVPSSQRSSTAESRGEDEEDILTEKIKQKFADRLEGISNPTSRSNKASSEEQTIKPSIKSRLDGKRSPSPIIFDKGRKITISKAVTKIDVPDKLPVVHPPLSIKNKERCKYWPSCRQGDKCEFVHPTSNCEVFPNCKFGESCLYIHPPCKFGSSCTKRDCIYSHVTAVKTAPRSTGALQQCKYFPTCTNLNCQFYHPKMCKFGKYCKNQSDCPFSHLTLGKSAGLSWRSNYT